MVGRVIDVAAAVAWGFQLRFGACVLRRNLTWHPWLMLRDSLRACGSHRPASTRMLLGADNSSICHLSRSQTDAALMRVMICHSGMGVPAWTMFAEHSSQQQQLLRQTCVNGRCDPQHRVPGFASS